MGGRNRNRYMASSMVKAGASFHLDCQVKPKGAPPSTSGVGPPHVSTNRGQNTFVLYFLYLAVYVVAVAGAMMLWAWAPPSDQDVNR